MVEVVLLAVGAVVAPVRGAVEVVQVRLVCSIHERSKEVQATRAFHRHELSLARAPLLFTPAGTCLHNILLIALVSMDLQRCAIFKNNLEFCFWKRLN